MTAKRPPTANLTLRRPEQPLTSTQVQQALAPLYALLNVGPDDVSSLTVTPGRIRLQLVPRTRGKRQLDSLLRVSYVVAYDGDE